MTEYSTEDLMKRAISLSQLGHKYATKGPWIGALIFNEGEIVSESHTLSPDDHTIIRALQKAGEKSNGSTVYLNFEPCDDCKNRIVEAKVKKVVIALTKSSHGVEIFKNAGIEVQTSYLEKSAKHILAPYLHYQSKGTPYVRIKTEMSLDGKIDIHVLSEKARSDAHLYRERADAILIGSETALREKPKLGIKGNGKTPIRVLLDARGRVSQSKHLFNNEIAPTIIYTTSKVDENTLAAWLKLDIEVMKVLPAPSGVGVYLPEVLTDLGKRGIVELLVEGGGKVAGSFISQRLAQSMILYLSPLFLGSHGRDAFEFPSTFQSFPIDWTLVSSEVRDDHTKIKLISPDWPI